MEGPLSPDAHSGPLTGVRVVELAGIGPGPHCAMMLADMGADVLRIDKQGGNGWPNPVADRGRARIEADIRTPEGLALCLEAIDHADVLLEGFRPGVMERLGMGPDVVLARNPQLVFGRMTGWGQTGPLAKAAGHDINYIALTGALAAIGAPDMSASVPLNLVGDFGGGSMFLLAGILAALYERERSGQGQVIDAAIVDGTSHLMSMFSGLVPFGNISIARDENILGGAAPFYRCYLCKDGKEMSVGPLEPKFFALLMEKLGLEGWAEAQEDRARWPALALALQNRFAQEPRDYWAALFEGSDACAFPVLELDEVAAHPHMAARAIYIAHEGINHVAPAPRFSRTTTQLPSHCDPQVMLERWKNTPRQ